MKNILGLGPLCGSRCKVTFDIYISNVNYSWKYILKGCRYFTTLIWYFLIISKPVNPIIKPATVRPHPQLDSLYRTSTTLKIINFFCSAYFRPIKLTCIEVIHIGFLIVSRANIIWTKKYLYGSIILENGHLDQHHKSTRSAKSKNDDKYIHTQEHKNAVFSTMKIYIIHLRRSWLQSTSASVLDEYINCVVQKFWFGLG